MPKFSIPKNGLKVKVLYLDEYANNENCRIVIDNEGNEEKIQCICMLDKWHPDKDDVVFLYNNGEDICVEPADMYVGEKKEDVKKKRDRIFKEHRKGTTIF